MEDLGGLWGARHESSGRHVHLNKAGAEGRYQSSWIKRSFSLLSAFPRTGISFLLALKSLRDMSGTSKWSLSGTSVQRMERHQPHLLMRRRS